MPNWFRDKLQSLVSGGAGRPAGGAAGVHLTAFGKHPGWDDHIHDIPLPTDTLVEFQRLLYLQGIGQNIETGKWQNAPAGHASPEFDHWIYWARRDREFIVARLWSSVDGKGRASYPLVIAAQLGDVPTSAMLEVTMDALRTLEARIRATRIGTEVQQAVIDAQARLRSELTPTEASAQPPPVPSADPMTRMALCVTREGLHRLMYEAARAGAAAWNGAEASPPRAVVTLRAPSCAESVREEMSLWIAFASRLLRPRPILIIVGNAGRSRDIGGSGESSGRSGNAAEPAPPTVAANAWVDVVCGESTAVELACLRYTDAVLPPTTAIPYSIDDAFRQNADAALSRAPAR
jgi:hypothetical protein